MAEILAAAYQDLRAHVVSTWTRVGLYDEAGVPSLALAPGDARVAWSGAGNPRTLTVALTAEDADTTGLTFARIKVFAAADVGLLVPLLNEPIMVPGSDPPEEGPVTLAGADTLVVTLTVELPDIA